MIGNIAALFKARKDAELAKRIASEMAIDGAVEHFGWPIVIAKFWMGVAIFGLLALTALVIWLAVISHWSVAISALLFGGIIYVIIRLWRGLNLGVERVTTLAKAELTQQVSAIQLPAKHLDS